MTKFVWGPSVSTPKYFDIWMKYALVGFGNKGRRIPAISYSRKGIGQGTSSVSLNDFDGSMSLPNSLDISWLSNVDRKIYKGNFEFSEELQNKILQYFRQGYRDAMPKDDNSTDITYDGINISVIPGGRVILYLTGLGRIVCLDTILQCNPINVNFRQFYTYDGYDTIDEYVDECNTQEDGPKMMSLLEQCNREYIYKLWDRYLERFNYDIVLQFEDSSTVEDGNCLTKYANGEMFYFAVGHFPTQKSRLKNIILEWNVADATYFGHLFFNEDEMLEFFDKAYGNDRTQKGEFVIKVSKYNNWFDICLRVGDQEFKFEKTMIHVFKQGTDQSDKDTVVFYNNHREIHSSKIRFIGE